MTGPLTASAACWPPRRWSENAANSESSNEIKEGNRAILHLGEKTQLVRRSVECCGTGSRMSDIEREREREK